MSTNWRRIADGLAARLIHHLGHEGPVHPGHEPADCPFCRDIAAYDAYVTAGGTIRGSVIIGKAISIFDMRRDEPAEGPDQ